jgi:molybdate transport system substrate-binding protein
MIKKITVVACGLLLAACSSSGGDKPAGAGDLSGSITVYAAASLKGTFTELADRFKTAHPGTDITFQFGSSGDLATQITQGAPADVFASAATKNMDDVVKAGDAIGPVDIASNSAEIAVPKDNPARIGSVDDLAKAKVALCVATAPCGRLAATVLDNAKVKLTPTTEGADVKATLALVESGEVDAGIVYVTDVIADGGRVVGVEIPDDINSTTKYPLATIKETKNPALAKAWVDYVSGPAGRAELSEAGFAAP